MCMFVSTHGTAVYEGQRAVCRSQLVHYSICRKSGVLTGTCAHSALSPSLELLRFGLSIDLGAGVDGSVRWPDYS